MNKKEILKRAQAEQKDERIHEIKIKSYYAGWVGVSVLIAFFIVLEYQIEDYHSLNDVMIILTANLLGRSIYVFYKEKSIGNLGVILMCLVAMGLNLATLLSRYGVY